MPVQKAVTVHDEIIAAINGNFADVFFDLSGIHDWITGGHNTLTGDHDNLSGHHNILGGQHDALSGKVRDNTTLIGALTLLSGDRLVLLDNFGIGGTSDVEVTWSLSDGDCKVVTIGGTGFSSPGSSAIGLGSILSSDSAFSSSPSHMDVTGSNGIMLTAEDTVGNADCVLSTSNGDFVTVSTVGAN